MLIPTSEVQSKMGSIVGKRIKIKKDRPKDDPLVFQPSDSSRLEEALGIAEEVMDLLPLPQRETCPPRYLKTVIDDLINIRATSGLSPAKTRRKVFLEKWIELIDDPQWTKTKKEIREEVQRKEEEAEKDLGILRNLFHEFNREHALTVVLPKMPGYAANFAPRTGKLSRNLDALLGELLATGELMTTPRGKTPKPVLLRYRRMLAASILRTARGSGRTREDIQGEIRHTYHAHYLQCVSILEKIQQAGLWTRFMSLRKVDRIDQSHAQSP